MRCRVIRHLMKATAKIKRCGFRCISRQANRLELHTGMFQQLLHQCFSHIATAYGGRNVHAAESSHTWRCIGVTAKAADGNQLPTVKNTQKTLTLFVESIGTVFPLSDESRQEPESFGARLGFQYVDLLGERFQPTNRKATARLGHEGFSAKPGRPGFDTTLLWVLQNKMCTRMDYNLDHTADQLWEPSSFSEAAMAAARPIEISPDSALIAASLTLDNLRYWS